MSNYPRIQILIIHVSNRKSKSVHYMTETYLESTGGMVRIGSERRIGSLQHYVLAVQQGVRFETGKSVNQWRMPD